MPSCVVRWCRTHSRLTCPGLTLRSFPSNPIRRKEWIAAVRLERQDNNWMPTKASKLRNCSKETASNDSAFKRNSITKEQQLTETLKKNLPGVTYISVEDISGGCGAMYDINVEAKEFIGLSTVKQHRLVTESLKTEIAEMHGVRIHTSPSVNVTTPKKNS